MSIKSKQIQYYRDYASTGIDHLLSDLCPVLMNDQSGASNINEGSGPLVNNLK